MVVDEEADEVADEVADMEVDNVADIEVNKVANMVANDVAAMTGSVGPGGRWVRAVGLEGGDQRAKLIVTNNCHNHIL